MLTSVFTLSLAIMGLWICFNWRGMIFEPLAYHIEGWCYTHSIPHWILKPLWACPTCMSSLWGAVYYIIYGQYDLSPAQMLIVIPASAFINTLCCVLLSRTTDEGCG